MASSLTTYEKVTFSSGFGLIFLGMVVIGLKFDIGAVPIGLGVGIVGLGLSMAHIRVLTSVSSGQVDEKIAMMWGYAQDASELGNVAVITNWTNRILADITALGRIRTSASTDQTTQLALAVTALIQELTAHGHQAEAQQIEGVFRTLFGAPMPA
jgi:hypothetical protein